MVHTNCGSIYLLSYVHIKQPTWCVVMILKLSVVCKFVGWSRKAVKLWCESFEASRSYLIVSCSMLYTHTEQGFELFVWFMWWQWRIGLLHKVTLVCAYQINEKLELLKVFCYIFGKGSIKVLQGLCSCS